MRSQKNVNMVARILENKLYNDIINTKWKRFRHCNAYISEVIRNRYYVIKSYNTIVAFIDDQTGELFELGKWSRTTSKQVTMIYNMSDYESYTKFGFSKLNERYLVKGGVL